MIHSDEGLTLTMSVLEIILYGARRISLVNLVVDDLVYHYLLF